MKDRVIEAMALALVRARAVPPGQHDLALAALRGFWAEHGIAIVWSVDDVLRLVPGLERSEAKVVLGRVLFEHQPERGVSNDTVTFAALSLFGAKALDDEEDDDD